MNQISKKAGIGFTLIELLIVIAILGVLAVGVLTAINVTGNINKANLAKAKTFSASLENALSINQVGKWSFEANANDTSGYGNNGTIVGGALWKTPTECGLGLGGCMSFDGVSGHVALPANKDTSLENTRSTYTFWINVRSFPGGNNIASAYSGNAGNMPGSINIHLRPQKVAIYVPPTDYDFSYAWKFNQWYYFAVVIDHNNNTIKAYANGSFLGTKSFTPFTPSNINPTIGSNQWSANPDDWLNGLIDEVAIYNQALTAYQIQHLYAQGLSRHRLANK